MADTVPSICEARSRHPQATMPAVSYGVAMSDVRVCGNGHLFPFRAGTCPVCDSLASRPATREEIESGEVNLPDAAAKPPVPAAAQVRQGSLGEYLGWGIALILLGGVVSLAGVAGESAAGAVIGYVIGVIGFVIALIGVIAIGVREGISAFVARAGLDLSGLSGGGRPPS